MVASNASRAIALSLGHEGGYSNHPDDTGGPTNKGITLASFQRYVKRNGTIADLKALTTAQATTVYKRRYWDAVKADDLPAGVDYVVADYGINSGPSRAVKSLQGILKVTQDGQIGPQTLAAVKKARPADLIEAISNERLAFMRRIRGGKDWLVFGKGWTRRVEEVRITALEWAGVAYQRVPPDVEPVPAKTGLFAIIATFFAAIFTRKGR